jgi:hypothetical protein
MTYEFFHVSQVLVGDAATSVLSNMLLSVLRFDVIFSEPIRNHPDSPAKFGGNVEAPSPDSVTWQPELRPLTGISRSAPVLIFVTDPLVRTLIR